MALEIIEINKRSEPKAINSDWFVVTNSGEQPLSLRGCVVMVSKPHARKSQQMAKLDPGFKLEPGGKRRLVAGNSRAKSHGPPPEDDVENYFLFMKVPLFEREGMAVKVVRGQLTLAQAVFDPKAKNCVAAPGES
jgi:hypothetical protein